MSQKSDYWHDFWSAQNSPHNQQGEKGYKLWADEYACLIKLGPSASIIEFACGDGEFYRLLEFSRFKYFGIDYSQRMIDEFRSRNPEVNVSVGDARRFNSEIRADLIFSSGLMQYLTEQESLENLRSCKKMLKDGGHILHLSVPWDVMRWRYYSGVSLGRSTDPRAAVKGLVVAARERIGLRPKIGIWHSMRRLRRIADSVGLRAEFYGSLVHPYRFHARFVHNDD